MPEGQTPKATIINFEVAKEKRLEEKNRQAQWIQERTQQPPRNGVDAAIPVSSQLLSESTQKPQFERREEFNAIEGEARENSASAEITNNVYNLQKARRIPPLSIK